MKLHLTIIFCFNLNVCCRYIQVLSSLAHSVNDIHSKSARRSSEEGARGGCDPAEDDDDGGVARSSPSAGASKYDSSSIGSTLVSGNNCKIIESIIIIIEQTLWLCSAIN